MLDPLKFSYRVMRVGCISLYPLYGGDKDQRRNYTLVPQGTRGLVSHECSTAEGILYLMIRFQVGGRYLHVKCAPAMVELRTEEPCE